MKLDNIVTDFQLTGICIVDVDMVVKKWTDKLSIMQHENDYTLYKPLKNGIKVKISEEQAKEIIKRLKLVEIQDSFFRLAKSYKTRSFVDKEIRRLHDLSIQKKNELRIISDVLAELHKALYISL